MSGDEVVQLMRVLMTEAAILCAPLLLTAVVVSLAVSLLQALTSIQDQTLSAVPRLAGVFVVTMVALPWMLHRLAAFTLRLFGDFHRYLG